jgi:hypothetical protein
MSAEPNAETQPIETTAPTIEQPGASTPAPVIDPNETPEQKAVREREENGRFRRPVQPRIDELTRKAHEAGRDAEYWRRRAEAAEKVANPPAAPKAKPVATEFDTYDAYVDALTDWKADEKVSARFKERDEQASQKTVEQTRASNWSKGLEAVRKVHADYDDVMAVSDVPVSDAVQELLLDSEHGPRLAYHLDRHPDVADRLNKMTPTAAAREIGRIEGTFEAAEPPAQEDPPETPANGEPPRGREPPATPPPKPRTTSAPPPARPAGTGKSTTTPLEKQSMDEYMATRKQQGASWARR